MHCAVHPVAGAVGGSGDAVALDGERVAHHADEARALRPGGLRRLHGDAALEGEGHRGGGSVGQRLHHSLTEKSVVFEDRDGSALEGSAGAVLEAGDVKRVRPGVPHALVRREQVHLFARNIPGHEHHHRGAAIGHGNRLREVIAGRSALHRERGEGGEVARRR